MSKVVLYEGIHLPSEIVQALKRAEEKWKRRDMEAWSFAEEAYQIVGSYIPEATELLAEKMGVQSVSTPQGYAKAYQLKLDLQGLEHIAPLPCLFITHYITVGKAYSARINACNGDEGREYVELLWADQLLREASKFKWTIEKLRGKLKKEIHDDSYENSVSMIISSIEDHIINAPYLGVSEFKAVIAARFANLFIKVLRWVTSDRTLPDLQPGEIEQITGELYGDVIEPSAKT